MTRQTENCIRAMLAGDDTISKSDGQRVLAILGGRGAAEVERDEVITRGKAAEMLKVCAVTVTNWGKRGIIHAVKIKGRRKAVGYSLSSITAFINGKASEGVRG